MTCAHVVYTAKHPRNGIGSWPIRRPPQQRESGVVCYPWFDGLSLMNTRVHHEVGYPVPGTKGGTGHVTVSRSSGPYERGGGCDQPDRGRVDGGGPPLGGQLLGGPGRLDPGRAAPSGATLDDGEALSPATPARPALGHAGRPAAASHTPAPGTPVREAPIPGDAGDSWLMARVTHHPAHLGGGARAACGGLGRTPGGGLTTPAARALSRRGGPTRHPLRGAPCGHDGPERPLPRPHDATAQNAGDRGKHKRPRRTHLLRSTAARRLLFLRATPPGRRHDKRLADRPPAPLPAGSQLWHDAGVQACTRDGVASMQPGN
jgi:hypothetical protein